MGKMVAKDIIRGVEKNSGKLSISINKFVTLWLGPQTSTRSKAKGQILTNTDEKWDSLDRCRTNC